MNLKTYFKDDLHDYLENPEATEAFVKVEKQEIKKLSGDEKYKRLSRLAVFQRLLGHLSEAHEMFKQAGEHFEKNHTQMQMINYLRWADAFRFEKRFAEAETILQKAEEILKGDNFTNYEDFYFQHLGKLFFDKDDFKSALSCFEKALQLRIKKGDRELIASTEFAIEITRRRHNNRD